MPRSVDRAHVCGLSLGGLTAMWLGVHDPSACESIVLASTAARIGNAMMWEERIAQVQASGVGLAGGRGDGSMVHGAFRAAHPKSSRSTVACCRETPAIGYRGLLRGDSRRRSAFRRSEPITAPTLIIAGITTR